MIVVQVKMPEVVDVVITVQKVRVVEDTEGAKAQVLR